MNNEINWQNYIMQIEKVMNLNLNQASRLELAIQIKYLSDIATPLMAFPLEERLSIAGVYKA
ncbi:oxalurate catabolism protein HpxX [Pantoea sp. SoEX]|uniref:oxalurate catabolism protein HpxX n=1 Tax=Pantoea sp. SoEX TaxID=2576763 RepID=UPI00135A7833|nr:oxalurate catabolism protein HpxX [Pantoea sp. SoEX]MXP51348.1 oxalurate catabolism protein HpxX [Pantoea sp. SoEX]